MNIIGELILGATPVKMPKWIFLATWNFSDFIMLF